MPYKLKKPENESLCNLFKRPNILDIIPNIVLLWFAFFWLSHLKIIVVLTFKK
uniref:Uncharacterized protein n=1 Tax=Meloidogyne enterolobii TaxID=390850 RepID=A0A6V7TUS5_MELEN|nr:unnamed protein product [Meloidogyne enterolobii]